MIPRFDLDKNQRAWLQEAWALLLTNGEVPTYKALRLNLRDKVGAEFNPSTIHRWLLINQSREITLLGVIHIEETPKILRDAEAILLLVKKKLIEADHNETFHISELAAELSLQVDYARVIFAMVSEFGYVLNSASSISAKGKHSYESFAITSDEVFDAYFSFTSLEDRMVRYYRRQSEYDGFGQGEQRIIGTQELRLGQDGGLQFNAGSGILGHMLASQKVFISPSRVKELMSLRSDTFDLLKLLHLCKEINCNYLYGNVYAVVLLVRAMIDHIPPIFRVNTFSEVANNYKAEGNAQSFKKAMIHLDNSLRNIGDSSIHSQIRKSEVVPNDIQIDFKNDLDVLLAEVVRLLKR